MDKLEVRRAGPDDVDTIVRYHRRCFLTTFSAQLEAGEVVPPDPTHTRALLEGWFEPGSGFETRVVDDNGVPVAHVTVSGDRLVHLFVDPDHKGKGIGRHLLRRAEAMLRRDGRAHVELHARVGNSRAVAFYESAGLEPDRPFGDDRRRRRRVRRTRAREGPHIGCRDGGPDVDATEPPDSHHG